MKTKADLFLTFAKIGAFTFGGGYAMISLIDRECVEKKKWLSEDEFMDMTVIAESTPGPVAINCATYVGYKKAGAAGAALATLGVVLPSFIIILLISAFFEDLMKYKLIANAFRGIRIAVSLLIIQAGVKMLKNAVKEREKRALNLSFTAVFFAAVLIFNILGINFSTIYLMLIAGFLGFGIYAVKKKAVKKK